MFFENFIVKIAALFVAWLIVIHYLAILFRENLTKSLFLMGFEG